ncbi:Unknown protein sequence [Pseudomonas savastanoi pv. phaseolicola]|nr:Unknown protein sequence [Pseudomonas savastanoi pv. phaseolicola]
MQNAGKEIYSCQNRAFVPSFFAFFTTREKYWSTNSTTSLQSKRFFALLAEA